MPELPDFNKMWDYGDPAGTEARFREMLPAAESDESYLAQLLTQIARCQGLQDRFDEAHATLDQVEIMLSGEMKLPRVRYLLERGRVFNSSGKPLRALPYFEHAWRVGEGAKLPRYAIDAIHMLAIATPDPRDQVEWNLKGIAMVEADPSQKGWLYAFYNNLGESYAKLPDYEKGLDAFRKLAALDAAKGSEPDIYNLKDQSRMLRLLGRVDEAMATLRPALERLAREQKQDGWIIEEHAECLLTLGKSAEAAPHFAAAHALLAEDPWVLRHDPQKLDRLKKYSSC
jgi:tetratricopeptide (TPR) repeat protein